MQILKIILYREGQLPREVKFNEGKLNIITGKSYTGKTEIIHIVDYVLGTQKFHVKFGKVREYVDWYGIILKNKDNNIFIARPRPRGEAASQSQGFIKYNVTSVPSIEELHVNSSASEIKKELNDLLNIESVELEQERINDASKLMPTVRHLIPYSLQEQNEVASDKLLFHREDESELQKSLKYTLPYFLGIQTVESNIIRSQLEYEQRQLRILQVKLERANIFTDTKSEARITLLSEIKEAGLVPESSKLEEIELEKLYTSISTENNVNTTPEFSDEITRIELELKQLGDELRDLDSKLQISDSVVLELQRSDGELNEQKNRLRSIGIMEEFEKKCAHCGQESGEISQTTQHMRILLERVNRMASFAETNISLYKKAKQKIQSSRNELRNKYRERKQQLWNLQKQAEQRKLITSEMMLKQQILGKISFFLQNMNIAESQALQAEIVSQEVKIKRLEEKLDEIAGEEVTIEVLTKLQNIAEDISKKLRHEYSTNKVRLNIKKLELEIQAGLNYKSYKMFGSATNMLCFHLIACLTLHKFFIEEKRPSLNFIILDQPSQVYFPSDSEYKALTGELGEGDREEVRQLYEFLDNFCREMNGKLQIICLEHANLEQQFYQESLIEPVWSHEGDKQLIPASWIEEK